MSSKKVPYHKHREAEEARKKVRVQPFRVTLQPYLTFVSSHNLMVDGGGVTTTCNNVIGL
jgi:hypothetical protein